MGNKKPEKHTVKCNLMTCNNTFELYYADEKELLVMQPRMRRCREHRDYQGIFKHKTFKYRARKETEHRADN